MTTLTFDTYESIKNLKSAGLEEREAEAIVAEFKKLQDSAIAHLATKDDILRLDVKMAEMKVDIIKWVFTIAAGQAALIVTLLKLIK